MKQSLHLDQQKSITEKIKDSTFESHWYDWHWHMKHAVKSLEAIETLLDIQLPTETRNKMAETVKKFPVSVTPYYLSLIDTDDYLNDPVFKQAIPDPRECIVSKYDMADPLHEDKDSPAPNITHRYPDRVLFHISNLCSMYCRHCTRKRKVGDHDGIPCQDEIQQGIDYIKKTPQVRDVLLSGGDPLMLSDNYLEWIIKSLREIDHVEIIRIGSRMPVVLPYRITPDLVNMLKKYQPLWFNTHFNHPREITFSSKKALGMLADGGIPLGNQTVLLAGINDCPRIMRKLVHKLVQNRVRPYYLYQCDLSEGLSHFRTPIGKGIEFRD
jgi:lysine 2,3-aminomutase